MGEHEISGGNHDAKRSGFQLISSVLPTSQVFTSGYVNTETILHFFHKITNERGTKTVFTYAHIKWFYGQSERAYYLNYFINTKYSLRNKEFAVPRFNTTTHGKHSITYISPNLWSLIPKNIGDLLALSVFRQRIGKLDLNSLLADPHCSECILCRT